MIQDYKDQFEVFLLQSDVEFRGVRKFPVSKSFFQFKRVETLVFGCVVIFLRYVEVGSLVYFPTSGVSSLINFCSWERFIGEMGETLRFLLNCMLFSCRSCKPIY